MTEGPHDSSAGSAVSCPAHTLYRPPFPPLPKLFLQLSDETLLDLVVGLQEPVWDEDDDRLGLPDVHLLSRGDVQVLQVGLPLGVVVLPEGNETSDWRRRGGSVPPFLFLGI